MSLSVISLLARLGVDPWQEAGRLAGLPKEAAGEWLAQKIASSPSSGWPLSDAKIIAARLIALLPPRGAAVRVLSARPRRESRVLRALTPFTLGVVTFVLVVILLAQVIIK